MQLVYRSEISRKKRHIEKYDAFCLTAYFWTGLYSEGNLRLKIDSASLIVGRKFTVFALFYFVLEGNFQVLAPGGLIFGGAIWGAYTLRGLFSEFYGMTKSRPSSSKPDFANFIFPHVLLYFTFSKNSC